MRCALALVGWIALLSVTLLGLITLGDGPLGAPPLTDPGAWPAWASSRPPLGAVFAVLRLVLLGLAWYLLGVSVIGLVLRLLHAARLVAIADVLTVPAVRRLLQGTLGVGLVTAAVTSIGTGRAPPAGAVTVETVATPTPAAEIMAPLDGSTAALGSSEEASTTPIQPPSTRPWVTRDDVPPPEPPTEAEARRWTVSSGEHFWSIAEQVLEEAWRRPAENHEIAPYWTALIEANRDALADPGNPDLVYPGQVFVLPDPPAATAAVLE